MKATQKKCGQQQKAWQDIHNAWPCLCMHSVHTIYSGRKKSNLARREGMYCSAGCLRFCKWNTSLQISRRIQYCTPPLPLSNNGISTFCQKWSNLLWIKDAHTPLLFRDVTAICNAIKGNSPHVNVCLLVQSPTRKRPARCKSITVLLCTTTKNSVLYTLFALLKLWD